MAAVARAAARNPNRRQSLPAALLLGVASGILCVEVVLASLVPVGAVDAPGSLLVRLAVLVVLAGVAAIAVAAGGGSALLSARGTAFLGLAAGAGALLTEGVDLHLIRLHETSGAVGGLLVHLVPIGLLCAGLLRAGRLAGVESAARCQCPDPCQCCGPKITQESVGSPAPGSLTRR